MEGETMTSHSATKKRPPDDAIANDTPMTKRLRSPAPENEMNVVAKPSAADSPTERPCLGAAAFNGSKRGDARECRTGKGWFTVEDLLAVPVEYILRQVPSANPACAAAFQSPSTPRSLGSVIRNGGSGRPLLSRTEASLLLRVQVLAQEVDILTVCATEALAQRIRERAFSESLEQTDHPYLRPLFGLLHVLQETLPTQAMQLVSNAMEQRVLPEMRRIVPQIRQCSEHNWTLADTLEDTSGNGNVLAEEKRQLSDLQEEVCQRIESIFLLSNQVSSTPSELSSSQLSLSMKEYCDRLFQQPSVENDIPEAIGNNHESPVAPMDVPQSTAKPKSSIASHEEEENEEVLAEEPPPSIPASPVSSPEESPTLHQVTDATKKAIRYAATPVSEPPATTTPASRGAEFSSSRRRSSIQDSIALFQEEETVEEKENAPSQSSSCSRRSQRTPTSSSQRSSSQQKQRRRLASATPPPPSVPLPTTNTTTSLLDSTGASDEEDEPPVNEEFFRSQGAAEVLSTLARTTIARSTTVSSWQNGSSSPN